MAKMRMTFTNMLQILQKRYGYIATQEEDGVMKFYTETDFKNLVGTWRNTQDWEIIEHD